MNELLEKGKKIVSGRSKRTFAEQKDLSFEELRKIVRRAVKSVTVSPDLEKKTWNLLRKQL